MNHLLLLGGGHSHIEVLRRFAGGARGAALTLVSPEPFAVYSGMLPGVVSGAYGATDCRIDLAALARAAGARLIPAAAIAINPQHRSVTLDRGDPLRYDILSLDVGSQPAYRGIEGATAHAQPLRPAGPFLDGVETLVSRTRDGTLTQLAVVGGGAAGVEIAFALRQRLRMAGRRAPGVALISENPVLLAAHPPRAQALAARLAGAQGIALHLGQRVIRVSAGAVVTERGSVGADAVIWATGPAAPGWLAASGLACDRAGYIAVDARLQSISHPGVFAAGDCASLQDHALPKSGVYAVREGPLLADNLRNHLQGRPLRRYRPQARALALLATGDGRAMAVWGPLAWEGAWIWRWKDRIDRRFVARYRQCGMAGTQPNT